MYYESKWLEDTEGSIKKGQSGDTGNIRYTRRRKKPIIICVGHNYAQATTINANKTCTLLQTTGGSDEPNIVLMRKS